MFDLHLTNKQRQDIFDLLKAHEGSVLMAEIAREFIFRITEIDDGYHAEIMEMYYEAIELSEVGDAHVISDESLRLHKEKQELDKSLVAAVSKFIAVKLNDLE